MLNSNNFPDAGDSPTPRPHFEGRLDHGCGCLLGAVFLVIVVDAVRAIEERGWIRLLMLAGVAIASPFVLAGISLLTSLIEHLIELFLWSLRRKKNRR